MTKYFDFDDLENSPSYFIYVGGRGYGKRIRYIESMCQLLFGGVTDIEYDPKRKCSILRINNDDIGIYDFIIYDETLERELLSIRLNRMCEEYHGYMLYKYRDYKE